MVDPSFSGGAAHTTNVVVKSEGVGDDDVRQANVRYAPFARNDKYGVAGCEGPPITARESLRVATRSTVLVIIILCFGLELYLSVIILGSSRANAALSNRTQAYACVILRVMGFELIRQEHHGAVGTTPVVVCNHVSWIDALVLTSSFFPSFVAKDSVRDLPIWGRLALVMRCLFVSSGKKGGGSSAALIGRIRDVGSANNRQQEGKNLLTGSIVVFPEGTTTNGSFLLPFRTGAFAAGLPVQPILLKYDFVAFNPSWETISPKKHIVRLLAQPSHRCHVISLPQIAPTGESKEDVRDFANRARDAIAEAGGLQKSDLGYQDKMKYHHLLRRHGYS